VDKNSHIDVENWGERVSAEAFASRTEGREPVVFNFRPTAFVVVDEQHRADWKRLFQDNVDVPVSNLTERWSDYPVDTLSGCGEYGWCDCDQG
jgi:hypothetical protein